MVACCRRMAWVSARRIDGKSYGPTQSGHRSAFWLPESGSCGSGPKVKSETCELNG
jgi:hypothetical protein